MGSIAIVGIAHDDGALLPSPTVERLKRADRVVVSSPEAPVVEKLVELGISVTPLSEIGLTIDMPVEAIIEGLTDLAKADDVAYLANSYPFLKQGLLAGLLARTAKPVDVFPSLSPLQVILMAFDIDLTADLDIVDAKALSPEPGQRDSHLIVTGVGDSAITRKVAFKLAEVYPSDHSVVLAGTSSGDFSLSLATVDSLADTELEEETALYVAPSRMTLPVGFEEFIRLIAVLRGPEGCPWDRAQDHMSLRRHMLEEAYEAVEAIESGDSNELADELGDVLLQIVLHAQIAAEAGDFTIDEVVSRISRKIRRRHPHVFADGAASTPDEVHAKWDAIKRGEKPEHGLLDNVPGALPALMRAQKISRRVVGVGFEWETLDDVWEKFHEEIEELKAVEPGTPEAAEEIGDMLFTLVNIARKQGIDAEEALRGTCDKFVSRWQDMEGQAASSSKDISKLGIEELEAMWQTAKVTEREGSDAEVSAGASHDDREEE